MEARELNPNAQETTWSDLRRDEERLRTGRCVLALLRAMEAGSPRKPSSVKLDEANVRDVLKDLTYPPSLVVALLRFDRTGTIPAPPGSLEALIEELDETLYYEGRLLAAER